MPPDIRDELREVARRLRRYGHVERADFLVQLADDSDEQQVLTVCSGLELWGGSGAVWEVEPFQYSHPNAATSATDYMDFQRRMISIAELLEAIGSDQLARRNADLFRRELGEEGVP